MELPIVNHKDYFAKIGDDHKFPIKKFGELANYLIKNNILFMYFIKMIFVYMLVKLMVRVNLVIL